MCEGEGGRCVRVSVCVCVCVCVRVRVGTIHVGGLPHNRRSVC